MPRKRTPADIAAARLISAVQKVWTDYIGTDEGYIAEAVINRAHDIHQAIIAQRLPGTLAGRTLRQFLDEDWITFYPGVDEAVRDLESVVDT
jgi:hypothetical protein